MPTLVVINFFYICYPLQRHATLKYQDVVCGFILVYSIYFYASCKLKLMWRSAYRILHVLHVMHIHSAIGSLNLQELHMLCKTNEFLYTNNSFQNKGIVTAKLLNMQLVLCISFNIYQIWCSLMYLIICLNGRPSGKMQSTHNYCFCELIKSWVANFKKAVTKI
jgi:hypothetical protein